MLTLRLTRSGRHGVTATARGSAPSGRTPELTGHVVVVIGGSAGIGLEIARRARSAGADVILTGRDADRLERAALEVGVRSTAAFDATDQAALKRFFDGLPGPVDHVVVTAAGAVSQALALSVARNAVVTMRPGGTLLLTGDTVSPAFTATLAVALAPVRVGVKRIAPGLVDTSSPASDDVAALAVQVMANPAATGATSDVDDGRRLLAAAA